MISKYQNMKCTCTVTGVLYMSLMLSNSFSVRGGHTTFPKTTGVINVTIASQVPSFVVDEKFVSYTIDSGIFFNHFRDFNVSSIKLQNVARGMPRTLLRIGGTDADEQVFRDPVPGFGVISVEDFDNLYLFSKRAGWQMSFDLNILLRNGTEWNSTNAIAVLDHAVSQGYIFHLELGNEPDTYVHRNNLSPDQVGRDYITLRKLMATYSTFRESLLFGPSVTQGGCGTYLRDYYGSGHDLTPQVMMNPNVLDSITATIDTARASIQKYSNGTQVLWMPESGLSWSRPPNDTLGFIAGFMWLDKLGMSASHGVSLVARQTFGNFMDDQYNPTPEYWLTYIFKRTVGRKVLKLSSTEGNHYFRIYAHCSLTQLGGIVFYYVNLYRSDVSVSVPPYVSLSYQLYSLTVGGNGTLSSSIVNLNGHPMKMEGDNIPLFEPVTSLKWPLVIPQLSYGFFVIPSANLDACK